MSDDGVPQDCLKSLHPIRQPPVSGNIVQLPFSSFVVLLRHEKESPQFETAGGRPGAHETDDLSA